MTDLTHGLRDWTDRDTMTTATRLRWVPIYMGEGIPYRCSHCFLLKAEHIRNKQDAHLYCPEWRLRQMDGDR